MSGLFPSSTTPPIHLVTVALAACLGCRPAAPSAGIPDANDRERVWSGEDLDLVTGDISPDGRYFAEINWASGDLRLIDFQGRAERDLTGNGYGGGGYAWMSAFSSDGSRLAVAWYVNRDDSHELRVMNADGTGSRTLIPAGPEHFYVDPVDWAPTDEEILVAVRTAQRVWQLVLVSVTDGATRIVKTLGWQTPGGGHDQAYPDAKFSPDGRYIAWDYPPDSSNHSRDIFAIDVTTGAESVLVSGAGSDRLLGWVPNGTGILFYSDRGGTPGVWRQPTRQGRAVGDPVLVRSNLPGLVPLGFTAKGYAYGVATQSERVHLASLERPGESERLTPVPDPVWRKSFAADWSPDGSRLAYITHDPFPDPVETLVVMEANGRVLSRTALTPALHSSNGTLRWITEHQIVLYVYQRSRDGIHIIDLPSGTSRRLDTPESVGRAAIKWFEAGPEGRTLFLIGQPKAGSRENEIVAFDVATGSHRVVGTARAIPNSLAVAPDGGAVAFLARVDGGQVELRTMPVTGSDSARAVSRTASGRMNAPVAWTPDGSRLVFELTDSGGMPGLWSIDRRGGPAAPLLPGCCRENDVRFDRTGRRAAFAAGADVGEIWILKF